MVVNWQPSFESFPSEGKRGGEVGFEPVFRFGAKSLKNADLVNG